MTTSSNTPRETNLADGDDGRPVARLSSPGELVRIVPDLLGFVPRESMVVVSLREPRGRVGLVQRLDLPPPGLDVPDAYAESLMARVDHDGGTGAAVLVFTEVVDIAGELPYSELVERLATAALRRDIKAPEALLVRGDRWWSYTCSRPCCPEEGRALSEADDAESVSLVAVERAMSGRVVFESREAMAESLAPVLPLGEAFASQALGAVDGDLLDEARAVGRSALRRRLLEEWRSTLDAMADPRHTVGEVLGRELIVSLHDILLRDCVLSEVLERGEDLQRLLELLCQRCVPPHDAPLCGLLAWVAYANGAGALAVIAAERALDDDPGYSAAHLVLDGLEAALPPTAMRDSIRHCREETYRLAGVTPRSS